MRWVLCSEIYKFLRQWRGEDSNPGLNMQKATAGHTSAVVATQTPPCWKALASVELSSTDALATGEWVPFSFPCFHLPSELLVLMLFPLSALIRGGGLRASWRTSSPAGWEQLFHPVGGSRGREGVRLRGRRAEGGNLTSPLRGPSEPRCLP